MKRKYLLWITWTLLALLYIPIFFYIVFVMLKVPIEDEFSDISGYIFGSFFFFFSPMLIFIGCIVLIRLLDRKYLFIPLLMMLSLILFYWRVLILINGNV